MSRKQRFLKNLRRVLYIILSIMLWSFMFIRLDSDLWCASCLILSFVFLLIFIISFKFNYANHKLIEDCVENAINRNPLPLDEIKKKYKYFGLDNANLKIIKLFYNEDGTKRCVIKQESNAVHIYFETLSFLSDSQKTWRCNFASWSGDYDENYNSSSIYADAEIAIRENKAMLKGFHEEDLNFKKFKVLQVEIEWKKYSINSKELPFGERITFDLKNKNELIKGAQIKITNWFNLKSCGAYLYIDSDLDFDVNKKCKMLITNNGEKLGEIYYYDEVVKIEY